MGKENGEVGNWSLNACGSDQKNIQKIKRFVIKHTELKQINLCCPSSPIPNEME